MIFATVGTQLAFPRLIGALDRLAPELGEEIIAQCGSDGTPRAHLELRPSLGPQEFDRLFSAARVVVGHAGIGTILSAKRLAKPLILLPRRHGLGEHRNDHQLATARQVEAVPGIHVAWEVEELGPLLESRDLTPASDAPSPSQTALIARIRNFIDAV